MVRERHVKLAPLVLVMTCSQCRDLVLDANQITDDEEGLLRDRPMAVHPNTIQPETRDTLLRHFVVSEGPPLRA